MPHSIKTVTQASPEAGDIDEGEDVQYSVSSRIGSNISVILLAAGSSSRMGQSKQLLDVNGETLLRSSVKTALSCGVKNIVVILGANEQAHREKIQDLPVAIIGNHYWKSGMGSSIKAGINYLIRETSETAAIIIMVCDQPALTADHLQTMIKKWEETRSPIIASAYLDTTGVPALFSRLFFSNLLMLRDEEGAKKILQQFREQVVSVNFPGGAFDLDTAEDYQNFLKQK